MVDLVGDDVEVMLLCQGQQLLAATVGERAAGGVLVGGDGVEKDGAVAGQGFCDGRQHKAVFIGGDGDGVEPVIFLEDAEGEEVAWLFDEDGVAGGG